MKIHSDDTVKIISGKSVGKTGKVLKVFLRKGRVLVEGVHVVQKHVRPSGDQDGGIIEQTLPIDVSNVMLLCPHCEKPTRIGYELSAGGKYRICKKCGVPIDS